MSKLALKRNQLRGWWEVATLQIMPIIEKQPGPCLHVIICTTERTGDPDIIVSSRKFHWYPQHFYYCSSLTKHSTAYSSLSASGFVHHVHVWCLQRLEVGIRPPGTGATDVTMWDPQKCSQCFHLLSHLSSSSESVIEQSRHLSSLWRFYLFLKKISDLYLSAERYRTIGMVEMGLFLLTSIIYSWCKGSFIMCKRCHNSSLFGNVLLAFRH